MSSRGSNLLRGPVLSSPTGLDTEDDSSSVALRGSLAVISILDVLQMVCNARQSWTVRLYGQGVDGDVVVQEGELVSARWGGRFGPAALTEIAGCNWGFFDLLAAPKRLPQRNLSGSWQNLLFAAVQALDELRRERELRARTSPPPRSSYPATSLTLRSGEHSLAALLSRPPSEDSVDEGWPSAPPFPVGRPQPQVVDLAASADALIDQGFAALRQGRRDEARARWTEALRLNPDNRSLQFNLRKLDSLDPSDLSGLEG